MPERRLRVLAIAARPAQYQAPLFRRMAARDDVDLHVAYCTLHGAEAAHDPEFGATVKWDVPLLNGYPWSEAPNRGSGRERFWGLRNSGLWRSIRDGHFDAVLCYVTYRRATFWIALLAAKISRAAFLFGTDTTTLRSRDGRWWKTALKRIFWPALFRLADQVLVPSSGTKQLIESLGIAGDRITLTPYTVDNDWWQEKAGQVNREAMREGWNIPADAAVVLFCAKLQPWKRPLDLLRAFARVNLADAYLVFAGEGPLRKAVETEAATLGVASRVRMLGFVNQSGLPAVYCASDLMVLPSEYEPFAVVVNEAMCCGCPVIASDRVGAAGDLIDSGRTGYVYPWGDVPALSTLLAKAVGNRSQLRKTGTAARARMASWSPGENIAATIEAILRGIARVRGEAGKFADSQGVTPLSQKLPE